MCSVVYYYWHCQYSTTPLCGMYTIVYYPVRMRSRGRVFGLSVSLSVCLFVCLSVCPPLFGLFSLFRPLQGLI